MTICLLEVIIYKRMIALLFLLLPILIGIIIKVYFQVKKYGKNKVFRFSHEEVENEQMNLIEHILRKQGVTHILKIDDSNIICISTSGVYFIRILEYTGRIEGEEREEKLILKDEGTKEIPNFFLEIKSLADSLDYKVQKIIIKKEICMLDMSYSKEYQVIGIHHFHFEFQKMNQDKIYTVEEVKSIYEEIKKLSNNVKL